jgi:nitrogen regulatory protein PII
MGTDNILITFIVCRGDAYDVMTTARQAGAKGGTILNGLGTSREGDVKFFGMDLGLEKDMLLVVAEKDVAEKIINATKEMPTFKKVGGGIIYTTDVNRVTTA